MVLELYPKPSWEFSAELELAVMGIWLAFTLSSFMALTFCIVCSSCFSFSCRVAVEMFSFLDLRPVFAEVACASLLMRMLYTEKEHCWEGWRSSEEMSKSKSLGKPCRRLKLCLD